MTVTDQPSECPRRADRRPMRRLRRAPDAAARRAGRVHPRAVAQQVLPDHQVGDQIYYDAPDYAHSYAMRVDTFPPDGEFAGSDPDMAFRQLIMEAGSDIAILEPDATVRRGSPRPPRPAAPPPTNGWPTTGWTATTTGTSAGAVRSASRSRSPRRGGARSRSGPGTLHGADPDQGRAAAVMGRPEVRPGLGGGHQARHHRQLPPVPRPVRDAADPAGRLAQLQPRLHGHLLAAGGQSGDEPDLRRGLRPLPQPCGSCSSSTRSPGSCR